jgi:Dullard-like phosphatase family protein
MDEFRPSWVRPTLVLDLDETLVFTVAIRPAVDHIPIRVGRRRFYVLPRPGLAQFISTVSPLFDIFFFSASPAEYANRIINAIAPDTPQERRLFRDSCLTCGGYPVKDLRLLRRPLDRVLLVDDIGGSALGQPQNLIRITPWHGADPADDALMGQLLPLLKAIVNEANLPVAIVHELGKATGVNLSLFPRREGTD